MVIDPSITHPEVESYNKIAEQCPYPCTYHLPVMSDVDSILKSLSRSCGIIILGSAASVHDQSDWQLVLNNMLFKAIANDIPILGICFGHQFLAHNLGGKVDFCLNLISFCHFPQIVQTMSKQILKIDLRGVRMGPYRSVSVHMVPGDPFSKDSRALNP